MNEKLECGHTVDIVPGVTVFNYYDVGFGTVVKVDTSDYRLPGEARWHGIQSHGAPYWAAGRISLLDPSRMTCEACGFRFVERTSYTASRSIDGHIVLGGGR